MQNTHKLTSRDRSFPLRRLPNRLVIRMEASIKENSSVAKDTVRESTIIRMETYIWATGSKIYLMGVVFISLRMGKGTMDRLGQAKSKATVSNI